MHKQQNSMLSAIFPPKVVSKPDPETGAYDPFPSFSYTGSVRAVYPLSEKREIPKSIPHPDYAADGIPKSGRGMLRTTKIDILDAKAQEKMRKVCRLAREVLDLAAAALRPGITTDEIDVIVHNACIERNVSEVG
jgi:methionyl aminopeptidase